MDRLIIGISRHPAVSATDRQMAPGAYNYNLEFVRFEISLFIAFWKVRARCSFNSSFQQSYRVVFDLFLNVLNIAQVHHTMGLFGVQAVNQNLINLYWRRGLVNGQLWEIVWLG